MAKIMKTMITIHNGIRHVQKQSSLLICNNSYLPKNLFLLLPRHSHGWKKEFKKLHIKIILVCWAYCIQVLKYLLIFFEKMK